MRVIEKPWGREKVLEENNGKYVVKILEVDAGKRLSLQYHRTKLETMYCLYGHGTLEMQTHNIQKAQILSLWPGRYITIRPGDIHRLCASDTSQLAVLECSTPEFDDVVRVEDDYGRN